MRICRIPVDVAQIRGGRVENVRIDLSRTGAGTRDRSGSRRIAVVGIRCGNLLLVIVQAVTAAPDYLSIQISRAPVETDLWSEIEILRVPGVESGAYRNPGQEIRAAPEPEYAHVFVLVSERSDVGIAKSGTQGQVRASLPVVLKEDTPDVFPVIVAVAAGNAC